MELTLLGEVIVIRVLLVESSEEVFAHTKQLRLFFLFENRLQLAQIPKPFLNSQKIPSIQINFVSALD
jgi:hypothetical protein